MNGPANSHNCNPICEWCIEKAAREISSLPVDYFDLKRDSARKNGASDVKIRRPYPEGFPLIDLAVDELCSDIEWTLRLWEEPVREVARLAVPAAPVRPGFAVSAAAAVLAAHVRVLAALDEVVGYHDGPIHPPTACSGRSAIAAFGRLHTHARARLGLRRRVLTMPGECSACAQWTLRRADGGDTVWCHLCNRRWSYEHYCQYVNLTVATLGEPGTVDNVA